jgi:hypothetical protein
MSGKGFLLQGFGKAQVLAENMGKQKLFWENSIISERNSASSLQRLNMSSRNKRR